MNEGDRFTLLIFVCCLMTVGVFVMDKIIDWIDKKYYKRKKGVRVVPE